MRALVKSLVLHVPGIKHLARKMKAPARNLATHVPGVRHLIWKRLLAERMSETESLVSAAQNVAHVIDNHMLRSVPVPAQSIVSMEVLLKGIVDRGAPLGAPLLWALQMYAIAKMGLQENYLKSTAIMPQDDEEIAALSETATQSAIVECIKTRRSVRRWSAEEVRIQEVRKLIDIAKWAPSSCNLQPWKVLPLTTPDDKQFMAQYYGAAHNRFWTSAPLLLVVLANLGVYSSQRTTYVQLDGGAFIQNLLLLFHAYGLAACWIGFIAWDNFGGTNIDENKKDLFYARFGVSQEYLPISLIPVGYAAVSPKPPARKSVDEIII